jgi:aspartyl/glutamyl-tRNA(Asn/Gln) amidotransferase C subunit
MLIHTHNIANLARISLTEDEHVSFNKDIESILSFIDIIQSLSVSKQDHEHNTGMAPVGVVRLDSEVIRVEEYTSTQIVSQAPASLNNSVKVKKILA